MCRGAEVVLISCRVGAAEVVQSRCSYRLQKCRGGVEQV